ncbi:MAG: hypothetical protein ACOYMS_14775 [Terrimicrobiaceae bacterium]
MTNDTEISLRPLADTILQQIPVFKVSLANAYALRGRTPKGDYEIRVYLNNHEIRTTFLRRGSNPLKGIRLICRTTVTPGGASLDEHIAAIQANEEKLPLITRETDAETGDDFVTIMPFGSGGNSPRVIIRKSSRTGFVSMVVKDAVEMSPLEAREVAKAIRRACKIADAERLSS